MTWANAAVMLAAFADRRHGVVLIERAAHLRRHPSQIGLPGGRADPEDGGDPVTTALREMREELGVSSDRVRVVGRLPDVRQTASRFHVTPVVAVLDPETPLVADGTETLGVFTIPLDVIVARGAIGRDDARSGQAGRTIYAIDYQGRHVWGFTARVLRSFARAWNARGSKLRAAMESVWRLG